ncbi:MAG: cupin domain-containing protein [Pseudobacteriovorax sp.]|nr:cupin domain-containing protein [Pseudobacteriovorax sp.]
MLRFPFDSKQFLTEYWQKKPVLIRGFDKNFLSNFDQDVIAGLALEPDVESRLVFFNDDKTEWRVHHGPFAEDELTGLANKGWTLLVQGLEQFLDEADALLKQFDLIPQWRTDDVMASLSPHGGTVGPHLDHYDVFLVQARGKKSWTLSDGPIENEELIPDQPLKILSAPLRGQTLEVETGDILYIPPKWGHSGLAVGESLTLSVGFRAPDVKELFAGLSQFAPEQIHRFSDPHRKKQPSYGEMKADDLEHLRLMAQNFIASEDFAEVVARFFSSQKSIAFDSSDEILDLDRLELDGRIYIRRGTRWCHTNLGQGVYVAADGLGCRLPEACGEAVRLLSSKEASIAKSDILSILNLENGKKWMRILCEHGIFRFSSTE